jgi:ribosomal protein S20
MFNNQTKEDKMSEEKTFWLVIEKYVYSNTTPSHSVKKTARSLREAMEFMVALEKLNEQKDVSYFLASDIDTVLSSAILHHNKAVKAKEVA